MRFSGSAENWTDEFSYSGKVLYYWTTFLDLLICSKNTGNPGLETTSGVWDKVFLNDLKLMILLTPLLVSWLIGIGPHIQLLLWDPKYPSQVDVL